MELCEGRHAFFRSRFNTKKLLVNLRRLIAIPFDLVQTAKHDEGLPFGRIDAKNLFKLVNGVVYSLDTRRLLSVGSADDLKINRAEKLVRFDVVAVDLHGFCRRVGGFGELAVA